MEPLGYLSRVSKAPLTHWHHWYLFLGIKVTYCLLFPSCYSMSSLRAETCLMDLCVPEVLYETRQRIGS